MSVNLTPEEFARLSHLVNGLPATVRAEFDAVLEGPKLRQLAEKLLKDYASLLQLDPKAFFYSWIVAGECSAIESQIHKFATYNPSFTLSQPSITIPVSALGDPDFYKNYGATKRETTVPPTRPTALDEVAKQLEQERGSGQTAPPTVPEPAPVFTPVQSETSGPATDDLIWEGAGSMKPLPTESVAPALASAPEPVPAPAPAQTVSSILQEVLPPAKPAEPSNLPTNAEGWVLSPLGDGQFRKRDQQIFPLGNVKDKSLTEAQMKKAGITAEALNPPFQVVDGELVKPGFTNSSQPLGAPATGFTDGQNGNFGAVQTGFADGNGETFGAPQTGFVGEDDDQPNDADLGNEEDENFDVEAEDEIDDNDVSLPGFSG